ncbi:pyruvate kinase [Rhodonellum psychrophilum GCM71 = DSM 17998]|uniref:Pyruvate kinase n=2 Tax=Rhodonellum TaxID=336827 RepID=U5C1H8_9BACT|nr:MULTISPECIES: pyruvate kinase [Rhodonellum]ERM83903.1 pyruvate kinase [Rhodonellum psychrophilum GCM71 = DSM 17998]MDO9550890.1 pyruvate kinase [Rhodonellum sp.]SDZ04671.1 pyruvate kinase [Rhodonellum ikkaensis]
MSVTVFNKTKILATVGPASNNEEVLINLAKAGANVFRLNFSHGNHKGHSEVIKLIRKINKENNLHLGILQDLQGPKIRVGEVENNGVEILPGNSITITNDPVIGTAELVSTVYQNLPNDVSTGDRILIDDGNLELVVVSTDGKNVNCTVIHGGILKSRKGINLPNTKVSAPSLTEKDLEDLIFGLENDVDWIALSFVRSAEDILDLRERIKKAGKVCKIVAKIEKPEALDNIDAIIEATDAIMVARGDLGVEVPMEMVPLWQKKMVEKCKIACKPVIIATQMLESMIVNPRPTRAETNDVATAVLDGADAVMLSAETASGNYPVNSVKAMSSIISYVENNADVYHNLYKIEEDDETFLSNNLLLMASRLSRNVKAKAIVGITTSGFTGFRIASHRPLASIFVFTRNKQLITQMSLVWGVRSFYYESNVSTDETFADIEKTLKNNGHVNAGDIIINTASMPLKSKGKTNMLKVHVVD